MLEIVWIAKAIERIGGRRPTGAWLAERVWEPDLPTALVDGGYEWTILDDAHFRAAAIDGDYRRVRDQVRAHASQRREGVSALDNLFAVLRAPGSGGATAIVRAALDALTGTLEGGAPLLSRTIGCSGVCLSATAVAASSPV